MRSFLLNCINGPLLGVNSHHIHLLCDDYEFARHHYETFDEAKFKVRISLVMDSVLPEILVKKSCLKQIQNTCAQKNV